VIDLVDLGWDARWAEAFAPHEVEGLGPGRVAIEFNHIYRVLVASGELQSQHSGRMLHRAAGRHELAAVGDWVAVRQSAGEQTGTIEAILPRRSKFSRKVAGELTEEQVVAANIDFVFLVMGMDRDFSPRRLERYLLTAYESGATPVIVLTKADLADDAEAKRDEIASLAPGTAVHALVAVPRTLPSGEVVPPDVSALEPYLTRGRTSALLGSSGVGKSTLINAITGTEALKTRAVRARDSRGRHTTRHRQLIVLGDRGLLIDTPGMRELQLWDVADAAQETFEDIDELSAACHFTDCQHRDEPRCAVKAAVAEGQLAADRLAGYLKLQDEIRAFDARRDARAQIEEKRQSKVIGRAIKQMYKIKNRDR
jgi:ribosome biogenesis GTPase / thiamine phosphate phosphatase